MVEFFKFMEREAEKFQKAINDELHYYLTGIKLSEIENNVEKHDKKMSFVRTLYHVIFKGYRIDDNSGI